MVSIFKEKPSGGYYCADCRMSFSELHTSCPYCGSVVANYEELLIKEENDTTRKIYNVDPITGRNKYAKEEPEIIVGGRWYETPVEEIGPPLIDEETWNKLVEIVGRKANESNIY